MYASDEASSWAAHFPLFVFPRLQRVPPIKPLRLAVHRPTERIPGATVLPHLCHMPPPPRTAPRVIAPNRIALFSIIWLYISIHPREILQIHKIPRQQVWPSPSLEERRCRVTRVGDVGAGSRITCVYRHARRFYGAIRERNLQDIRQRGRGQHLQEPHML
jgi:hypothetical protein